MADTHSLIAKLKELHVELKRIPSLREYMAAGATDWSIRKAGGYKAIIELSGLNDTPPPLPGNGPKILLLDIETSPVEAYVWALFDQNVGLNQVKKDWYVLSWAAKWLDSPADQVFYADTRGELDDNGIMSQIWQLLDEADIVITQNGIRFDIKKLNARFIQLGYPRPATFRQIDTLRIAKKYFSFTSNKLEYLTDKLCVKYKKLTHAKYAGFSLWSECLKGNLEAWEEMKKYNMYDVLSLEELYLRLRSWDTSINFNVFNDTFTNICSCGSDSFRVHDKDIVTNTGRFTRIICEKCQAEYRDKNNLISKIKRESLKQLS